MRQDLQFERNKPITQRLKNKFNKVIQTIEYKKYELKEKKGLRLVNLDKNKTLTGIEKLYKATITDEQSAFKDYTTSYAISNIRVRGIKVLQYLKHQDFRMKEYLRQNKGMKVMLETFTLFPKSCRLQWSLQATRGETAAQKKRMRLSIIMCLMLLLQWLGDSVISRPPVSGVQSA